ncbi:hypothetical protein QTP70_030570 [Hemibagrus guttatus]|uniref:HN1-like protein n=1 Tax=Hemibagrus guttatus TaxID=175788 RepID=A0AAE0QHC8_9TELE|nr:hypothetical protein QTP70_030570 [Hemibagrus guttatus]KAK3553135.1 hypothetical protein QTP86_031713 [Hemibagrus guttatus]
MTSTNTYQGLEDSGKPSSRVLRPPGGGSSNIFGGYGEDAGASRRTNKMASTVFAPPEEPQGGSKRSNPPGGKCSGIFTESEASFPQHKSVPSGGATSNIFGGPEPNLPTVKSHPNKPKDNISLGSAVTVAAPGACIESSVSEKARLNRLQILKDVLTAGFKECLDIGSERGIFVQSRADNAAPQPKKPVEVKKEVAVAPQATPTKGAPPPEPTASQGAQPSEKDHEPRLGPLPRSHNRVLNPPGGKSSVVFY